MVTPSDVGLSRKEWSSACGFALDDDAQVLEEVLRRSGPGRVVIFDLDSTLYDVSHRTRRILTELSAHAVTEGWAARDALKDVNPELIGFSVQDTLRALGFDPDAADHRTYVRALKAEWGNRFFTDALLAEDRPYSGAVEFVNEVARAGTGVAYLTGRDRPGMGKGTLAALARDGFPAPGGNVHLFMKPDSRMIDSDYKVVAARDIAQLGRVVASFENEPKNLMSLFEIFPDAAHVFMDSHCSERVAPVGHGLYRIRGYRAWADSR